MSDFFTMKILLALITSAIGSVSFAIIYRVAGKYLPLAAIGGASTYFVYYTVAFFDMGIFASALLSSAFSALFSEIFAKIKKAPVSIFLLPCSIPIVPGSALYYTMANFISRDFSTASYYLNQTLGIGLGIAAGIVIVPVVWQLCFGALEYFSKKLTSCERD